MGEPQESTRKYGGKYIYEELRRQILTLQLRPGVQLDEVSLATQFGVSRSPVRDALAKLISDGLVTIYPNRTTLVTPFEIDGFPKFFSALDLMQRSLIRLAAAYRTEEDLKLIQEANINYVKSLSGDDFELITECNKTFLVEAAKAARNPYLSGHYEKLLAEGQRLLHLHHDFILKSIKSGQGDSDFSKIVYAIEQQDVLGADEAAHAHALLFRDRFLGFLKHNAIDAMPIY